MNETTSNSPPRAKPRKLATRAVKEIDKQAKRAELIRIAASMLDRLEIDSLSMDDLARKAKVAKGTLYLYFQSKEELALSVHLRDFRQWFAELDKFLSQNETVSSQMLVDWLIDSMRANPRLLQMIPLVPTIFEKRVPLEALREYKLFLHQTTLHIAMHLSQKRPGKDLASAVRLLTQFHATIIGLWALGFPAPKAKQVIEEENLELFKIDYFEAVRDMLLKLA